ncbi:MBL fold metallo-hydrolase [Noviherbaspirillum soli]|uniref:MBL fold metallo-hydrolase n=1 Tax=Noviherbaspirillum soli TaxID=1064518 RepID=UPI00188D5AF3|nr:MBL fold metallo-hydrolase [Noviherbaspirillum soli]
MSLPDSMHVLQRGWLSSNNILFIGREQTALVDSGYATHAPQTLQLVAHLLQGRPLDLLLNTHTHSDHVGGNAALQQAHGCRTVIPAAEAPAVRDWNEDALSYRATGQHCPRFRFDATMAAGDTLVLGDMEWQVLGAPGHDPHSLILYCPSQQILISADALWENGFGVIFPELEGEPGFDATRATLEQIAALDVRLVIPGHGAPFSDVAGALQRAFKRLDYLAADPARNAQNGIKVLVKFRLLEKKRIPLTELRQWMHDVPLLATSNRMHLRMEEDALADWTASQLVRAGVARVEQGTLVDC